MCYSAMVAQHAKKLGLRYLMRPKNKDESFDREFGGCYNARIDSLDRVQWWKNVFGKNHGIMVVHKFYENVTASDYQKNFKLVGEDTKKENLIICFEPESKVEMLIPILWDRWEKNGEVLYSAAVITDEPPPEVKAAGHDRCPIFLSKAGVDEWLNPEGKTVDQLMGTLSLRERPKYGHKVVAVA